MSTITQKQLKKLLYYTPHTGTFTRLISTSNVVKVGDIAGCLNAQKYYSIRINKKSYLCHRLAWLYIYGYFPKNQIDHINHNRGDNRICNLREVTMQENKRNSPIPSNNTSGTIGVYWHKQRQKWLASIKVNKKQLSLGIYKNKEDAIKARKHAEKIYKFHKNHGK